VATISVYGGVQMPPRVLWEVLVIIVLKQTIQALEEVHKKRSDFIISQKQKVIFGCLCGQKDLAMNYQSSVDWANSRCKEFQSLLASLFINSRFE